MGGRTDRGAFEYPQSTGLHETDIRSRSFALAQNYPNPFNPVTTIRFILPERSHVTLSVYNALGQTVATLLHEVQEAGYHDVQFDGSGLASGMYVVRIMAGSLVGTRHMVLLR